MFSLWNSLCLFSLIFFSFFLINVFFSFFLFLPNHQSVLWFNSFTTQPQHRSLSTNPDQKKKFETQKHLQSICMREEPGKKKMELKASNIVCDLDLLVGGCTRDRRLQVWNSALFTYFWFLVLQNYCCCENWGQMKEMEGNWGFLAYAFRIKNSELSSPKILSFEFLCLCLCESLVNSDLSEYLVLYLDHMNESLDFYSGWICVVFAICRCSSLQLSMRDWKSGFLVFYSD